MKQSKIKERKEKIDGLFAKRRLLAVSNTYFIIQLFSLSAFFKLDGPVFPPITKLLDLQPETMNAVTILQSLIGSKKRYSSKLQLFKCYLGS